MKEYKMNRSEFIKRSVRYLLFGILAAIAIMTGSRVVKASECSSCPGRGICRGEQDCSSFSHNKDGKR